jgi:hypothetical protein
MKKHIISLLITLIIISSPFITISISSTDIERFSENAEQTKTNGTLLNQIWPMFKYNAQHTARTMFDTSNNTGVEKWRLENLNVGVYLFTPLIDNNGILYVTDGHKLYSMNSDGTIRWRRGVQGYESIYSLGLGPDGTIYIGSSKKFYAFNSDNTTKWVLNTDQYFCSLMAFGSDSTIYTGTDDGSLYAIKANGTIKWEYDIGSWIISVSLDYSENIYTTARYDNYLYSLYPNGTLRWKFLSPQDYFDSPLIMDDNNIFITTFTAIYALDSNGEKRWEIPMERGDSPALTPNGTLIYSPYLSPEIYAIDPEDGHVIWVYNVAGSVVGKTSVVIGGDGTIYCPYVIKYRNYDEYFDEYEFICALTSNGQLKWIAPVQDNKDWVYLCANPSINADGTIYTTEFFDVDGDSHGGLHAFSSGQLGVDAGGPYYAIKNKKTFLYGSAYGGTPPYMYHWNFGDGSTSNEINPSHVYTKTGNYTVTFTVTDSVGTIQTDTSEITTPYSYEVPWSPFIQWLFERFPNAFPILRYLIGFYD